MDDFGSGYSSMTSLNQLPFDTLKLDKSLIDYIENPRGKEVIRHTIALAHSLGMQVLAEGVETASQVKFSGNWTVMKFRDFIIPDRYRGKNSAQILWENKTELQHADSI